MASAMGRKDAKRLRPTVWGTVQASAPECPGDTQQCQQGWPQPVFNRFHTRNVNSQSKSRLFCYTVDTGQKAPWCGQPLAHP